MCRIARNHVIAGARLYIKHLVKKEAMELFLLVLASFYNNAEKVKRMALQLISTGLSLSIPLEITSIGR